MGAGRKAEKEVEEYKMEIRVLDNNKKKKMVSMLMKGVQYDFINSLRRTILEEVPTMAIEDIEISENSSALYDEVLALRLGLVPLKTDLKSYFPRDDCTCKGEGCVKCSCAFTLKAKGPCTVYASDLKSKDPAVKPVHQKMIIVKLLKNQAIEFAATATLGKGKVHNKWSPGLAFYKHKPSITISKKCNNCKDCVAVCPLNIFAFKSNKLTLNKDNVIKCHFCGACLEVCEPGAIKLDDGDKDFIFDLESWGQLEPKEILTAALDIQNQKLNEFSKLLKAI